MTLAALLLSLALVAAQEGAELPEPVARALRHLGAASLEEAQEALGRTPDAETAAALARVAQHHTRAGEHALAEPLLVDALRMQRELFGAADARNLYVAGQLCSSLGRQGRFAEAVEFGEGCLMELAGASGLDPQSHSTLLGNHAINLQAFGEVEASVQCQRDALAIVAGSAGTDSAHYAQGANNLALVLGELGQRREAFALAREALRLRRERFGADSPEHARTLVTLGVLHLQTGELAPAEVCLRRAEEVLRREQPVDALDLGNVLEQLGGLCLTKGDAHAAVAAQRESRALRSGALGEGHPLVAVNDVGLGFALLRSGEAATARAHFERAAAACELSFGARHWSAVQARCGLARALELGGERAAAVELLRTQVEHARALGAQAPELEPSLRSQLAACLEGAGAREEAERELRAALASFVALFGADTAFGAEPRMRLARLLAERGEPAAAETEALRALEVALAQRGRVAGDELARSLWSAQLALGDLGGLVAGLRVARGDADGALDLLERVRAGALATPAALSPEAAEQREPLLAAEEQARTRLRALEARLEARTARGEANEERALAELAAARNALTAASVALVRPGAGSAPVARSADARALRARLGEGEALLSFSWSADAVRWIALAADDPEQRARAGTCAAGREQVAALSGELARLAQALATDPRRRASPLPPTPAVLRELARSIAARGVRRLWIVPEGALGSIPPQRWFEGLDVAPPELAVLPTATALLEHPRRGAEAQLVARAVVLGDPDFGAAGIALARAGRGLERLPATRAEARYVAGLLGRAGGEVELLLGEEATRERLESAGHDLGILHLATHGFPGSERAPYDAALALAAAPADGAGDWSDALTLDRLLRRWGGRLDGCGLVVLSACETHREVAVGTGLYSLATGFLRAGADSVVASLWRVDEIATALLMGRLFENLTGARPDLAGGGPRLSAGDALREAQGWLARATRDDVRAASLRMGLGDAAAGERAGDAAQPAPAGPGDLRPYSDPYFWSGFVRIGP